MFGPLIETWGWIRGGIARWPLKKHRLSFITIHYLYILAMVILASILIYPAGGLLYIDALFFASGVATQSGLNTVNINDITTYQQIVLYIVPFITNPILINTVVVFVRLYWFEKRFLHIVKNTTEWRRSRTRSRSMTENEVNINADREEKGVNGRNIVVLRKGSQENGSVPRPISPEMEKSTQMEECSSPPTSSDEKREGTDSTDCDGKPHGIPTSPPTNPSYGRDVTFTDKVRSPHINFPQTPLQLSAEQHIAFLENQRNPKDKKTLRIPGPRDFDRGDMPETVDRDGQADDLPDTEEISELNSNDHAVKRNITIDEPSHPRSRTGMSTAPKSNLYRPSPSHQRASFDGTPSNAQMRHRSDTLASITSSQRRERDKEVPYLSWQPTIGRNSAFVDLTEEQREELGGIEYRTLKTLALVLVSYLIFFHLLGVICLVPWIVRSGTFGPVVDSAGVSRAWWAIFLIPSVFHNVGFALTPDSLASFQTAVFPLLLCTFLIIIGNTGFPCMLRFIIWTLSKLVRRDSAIWEELKFLLDHPRRCFTLLFPSTATWWLFWTLVLLNGIDLVFYIILDLHDPVVTSVGVGYRIVDGLLQAASTRTTGVAVVSLSGLHPAIQVSYLIMMYISVFPVAISMRRTNVYEEKSLGIYGAKEEEDESDKKPSYVGAHLRRQLSFDLWYIFLGLFIIALAEGNRLQNTSDVAFTLFAVLFEIVSAYGTVGLSLGYPNIDASLSAEFTVLSKLTIIAMQIRGRNRGLPYELDRAILLPSESLHKKEDEDAAHRMMRRNSNASTLEASGQRLSRNPTATTTGREKEGAALAPEKRHGRHARNGLGNMMASLAGSQSVDVSAK